MDYQNLKNGLEFLLKAPRADHLEAVNALRFAGGGERQSEEWNTDFTGESLYEAWSQTAIMDALYSANERVIRAHLDALDRPFTIVEMGGGNGRLWQRMLKPEDEGTLFLIDPVAHVHEVVAKLLPEGVSLESHVGVAQDLAALPEADVFLSSLTLHHVPGWNCQELEACGMNGTGKLEVLEAAAAALKPRGGIGVLNEADIYCDIGLASGSEALVNNIIDSYVRRTAIALLGELESREDVDEDIKRRWLAIIHKWCLDQVDMAFKPMEERDVYELNVHQWLTLIQQAGFEVREHRFTDAWCLFQQYVFQPK